MEHPLGSPSRSLSRMPESLREDNGPPKGGIADFFISLVWLVWLISSLYLIAMSAYYAFLSVVFTGYSIRAHVQPGFIEYIVSAALGSVPLLCSVVIAIVGFFLWRIARFRILGLWIIS